MALSTQVHFAVSFPQAPRNTVRFTQTTVHRASVFMAQTKSQARKRIAMSVPHGLQHMEKAIHGITDYAKQHAHWSFTRVPETFGTSVEWLRYWHGDGAFVAIYTPEDARIANR